jgi:predicted lipoprotein with Yx(FWY)xxD motif
MSTRILVASGAAVLALVTACSSSNKSGSGGGGGSSTTPAASTTPTASSAPAGTVTVSVSGSVLTGPDGRTLYANTVDTASKITCVGNCAAAWPPLTGTPKAGSGVDDSELGTVTRPDGTTQVAYEGHPLYAFKADTAAGDKRGAGIAYRGGKWYVATVTGAGGSGSSSDNHGGASSGPTY